MASPYKSRADNRPKKRGVKKYQKKSYQSNIQKSGKATQEQTSGQNVQKSFEELKEQTSGQNVQKSFEELKEQTSGQNVQKSERQIKEERSKQKKRRVQREHIKQTARKENLFAERSESPFQKDRTEEFYGSRKLKKDKKQAESAAKKLERARKGIPQKREYTLQKVVDKESGRTKYAVVLLEKEKLFVPENLSKATMRKVRYGGRELFRENLAETEDENSAVESIRKSQQVTGNMSGFIKQFQQNRGKWKQKRLDRLERNLFQKETKFRYQKLLEENPKLKKKALQKRIQKQRIKREYVKAKRKAILQQHVQETVLQKNNLVTILAAKLQETVRKGIGFLITLSAVFVLLVMLMTSVSSCGSMFADMQTMVLAASYMSEPKEIDAADLEFTRLELELQKEIDRIETDYPGYDEYSYNLGEIGHNPFTLINYFSAVYTRFFADSVEREVLELFEEMYELTLEPETETRTREVQKQDEAGNLLYNEDGTPVMGEEEYEVSILKVTLTVTALENIVEGKMTGEQIELYEMYGETKGLLQQFDTPLKLYWYQYISSYYGYRKNPITGEEQFHRGVDIAIPTGTRVYAPHDGVVTQAAYDNHYGNYVVLELDGYVTKYAHLESLNVRAGQNIEKGTVLGTTGNTGSSTGSHLHIECMYNGEYYNPLFYFEAGTGTIYGEAIDREPTDIVPPGAYNDATVEVLMEEAARYLGYPYVYGGSSPETGFDCSGFVCWVFTNSGVKELPRTNVRGIYSQCTPVSPSEAKAGDLIFFTGTYGIPGLPSHVGIYCGDGIMIHCGDPISYATITSSYWQSHFYGFGRLN